MVIWVQGCSLHCKGCINRHLWDPTQGEEILEQALVDKVINDDELDGITFLGGEPMEQSESLLQIAKAIRNANKTIVCFTGYEINELIKDSQIELYNLSDILICGRYIQEKRNLFLQFRGSENQRVLFPTGIYKDYKLKDGENIALISINGDDNGQLDCKGFPNDELKEFIKDINIF